MIELWWMPGTFVSDKILQEINREFLRTISQKENYVQYKNSNNKQSGV